MTMSDTVLEGIRNEGSQRDCLIDEALVKMAIAELRKVGSDDARLIANTLVMQSMLVGEDGFELEPVDGEPSYLEGVIEEEETCDVDVGPAT